MIADTTFVSDLLKERRRGVRGPATEFLQAHRREPIRTSIITAGELAVLFPASWQAWDWLAKWKILPLHPGVAQAAADVDRALMVSGRRLGENDNWIAGFATYYRESLLSHDAGFDGIAGLRRVVYPRKASK
jgi:predicted nucleic acid-binding protein